MKKRGLTIRPYGCAIARYPISPSVKTKILRIPRTRWPRIAVPWIEWHHRWLVRCIQRQDAESQHAFATLCRELEPFLRLMTLQYSHPDWEFEDRMQTARLALWEAARRFNWWAARSRFTAWVGMVVQRRLRDASRAFYRAYRIPSYVLVSLDEPLFEDGIRLMDVIPDEKLSPEHLVADEHWVAPYAHWLREHATPLERRVAIGLARGLSYRDIAQRLQIPVRSVDNARQRLRLRWRKADRQAFGQN